MTTCGAPFEEEHSMIDSEEYVGDLLQQAQRDGGPAKCLLFKKALFSSEDNEITEPRFTELCFLQVNPSREKSFLVGIFAFAKM